MKSFWWLEEPLAKVREADLAHPHHDDEQNHILLLNTLAFHYIELSKQNDRSRLLQEATELLNLSEPLDRMDPFTLVLKATISLENGKLKEALYLFQGTVDRSPDNMSALSGLVPKSYYRHIVIFRVKITKKLLESIKRYSSTVHLLFQTFESLLAFVLLNYQCINWHKRLLNAQ